MSKKRMMSKAQRIYYEQCKKERIRKELMEQAIKEKEYEIKFTSESSPFRMSHIL